MRDEMQVRVRGARIKVEVKVEAKVEVKVEVK